MKKIMKKKMLRMKTILKAISKLILLNHLTLVLKTEEHFIKSRFLIIINLLWLMILKIMLIMNKNLFIFIFIIIYF